MKFTELAIRPAGKNRWQLLKPLYWSRNNKIIKVPKDFITDFASVPRMFWSLIPPWGRYGKAAILHDFLYFEGKLNRLSCDKEFLIAMKYLNVPFYKYIVMYRCVRLFGKRAWDYYREKRG